MSKTDHKCFRKIELNCTDVTLTLDKIMRNFPNFGYISICCARAACQFQKQFSAMLHFFHCDRWPIIKARLVEFHNTPLPDRVSQMRPSWMGRRGIHFGTTIYKIEYSLHVTVTHQELGSSILHSTRISLLSPHEC